MRCRTSTALVATALLIPPAVAAAQDGATGSGLPSVTSPAWTDSPPAAYPAELTPLGILLSPFRIEEDDDGPINTDRPTFTPSSAIVPPGRFQIESGYTYTHDESDGVRTDEHLFPELALRYGLSKRAELRLLWLGQTYSSTRTPGRPIRRGDGLSDLEAGFKWQLIAEADGWTPQTALITSVTAPTGGNSPLSSQGVRPVIFLLYNWSLTDRLGFGGSTSYSALKRIDADLAADDNFQQFAQSLIASYTFTDKVTGLYEWFVLHRVNSADDRPDHFMDGALLYKPTPNTQLDLRAGFGLGDHPNDFFAGAGFSIRY